MMINKILFTILIGLGWWGYAFADTNAMPSDADHQTQGSVIYRFNNNDHTVAMAISEQPLNTSEELRQFALNAEYTPVENPENSNITNPINNNSTDLTYGYYRHGYHGYRGYHHNRGWHNGWYRYPYYGYGYNCFSYRGFTYCGY